MTEVVEVLQGIMGVGKSNGIIDWIDNNPNERYIFVSPLLSEVEEGGRLSRQVTHVTFECPSTSEYDTKTEHLLKLLQEGRSIACTHSLYLSITDQHLNLIERWGYIVIIDEEIDVINGVDGYSRDDYDWLYENKKISVCEKDGMVQWVCEIDVGKDHKYYPFKKLCEYQALYVTKRDSNMMVTQLPIKLITKAKRCIVLTYMFEGNVLDCFLRLKGIQVKQFDGVQLGDVCSDTIRSLITLLPLDDKVSKFSLSSTWYDEANGESLKVVSSYISNLGRRNNIPFDELMYTLPKHRHLGSSSKNLVKPPKYYRKRVDKEWVYNWIPAQTRATNDYSNKSCVVHMFNRFPMVTVQSYLSDYGCPIDNKVFSTSEMVQWIWRSRIRKGESIILAIGSKRMYNLFENWLKEL